MFSMIKDFLEWRRNFKPIEGKPIHVNLRANSPASVARHLGRILRLLQVLQDDSLSYDRREELESEFNQHKAALAVVGVVLPDSVEAIQSMYDKYTGDE